MTTRRIPENATGWGPEIDAVRQRQERTAAAAPTTTTREICTICGMVANIDPSLHTERYGHVPEVYRDGQRLRFNFQTYTFTQIGAGR